ncbi:MAG TPA: hypothetical protein VFQ68_12330 [Streptosporangiaceae bacterium]|nr:hypothetical protein [Streptosporangiaceae bacterium]
MVRVRPSLRQLASTHTSGIDGDVFTDTGGGDDCVERYVGPLGDGTPYLYLGGRVTPQTG